MLVLTRREGESIVIADNIVVRMESISGNRVKVSIDAPRDVIILRKEIVNERSQRSVPSSGLGDSDVGDAEAQRD